MIRSISLPAFEYRQCEAATKYELVLTDLDQTFEGKSEAMTLVLLPQNIYMRRRDLHAGPTTKLDLVNHESPL
ncbi:hypothetical protein ECG_00802 [Echinococcus granulosus]|uniref:DUF2283 domain-containing protein n=1 Tax=Echinococcus granulosus TaxID=6210 RepID=A0A068WD60_ECHGR|nr:hypothetical protein ECG_00802 [Echinococcus granulosus]CDS16330.1 hypothetical protein EgrG_002019100 [Echinococcus granulosus]